MEPQMCIRDRPWSEDNHAELEKGWILKGDTIEEIVQKMNENSKDCLLDTSGVVLGVGRAIGETMAVIMVAGNQPLIPESIFNGVRTMTANIVLEMGYAADLHRGCLLYTSRCV